MILILIQLLHQKLKLTFFRHLQRCSQLLLLQITTAIGIEVAKGGYQCAFSEELTAI